MKEGLDSSPDDHFGKLIELTWKLVTLPNPLIVCQPEGFNSEIHDHEVEYWDKKKVKELPLIYIRPVLFRNYEGVVAQKGWVANAATIQQNKWGCRTS